MSFWESIFGKKPPVIQVENAVVIYGTGNRSEFQSIDAGKAKNCQFVDGGGPGFSFEDALRLPNAESRIDRWLENRSNRHFLDYVKRNPGCDAKDCDEAVEASLENDMGRWFSGK